MAWPAGAAVAALPKLDGVTIDVLDHIRDGFLLLDRHWRILHANTRMLRLWGAELPDVAGQVLWDRFPQLADSDAGRRLRRAVDAGDATEFEILCPIIGRQQAVKVLRLQAGLKALVSSSATLAPRERMIRVGQERLRLAAEMARMGFWERDLATGELWSSDQCKANYGLAPDTNLTYDMVFAAIDLDYRETVRQVSQRAVRERCDYQAEYPITWPDGSRHWISVRGRCLYGEDGEPRRNVGVTIDITDRKETETVLRELTETLEARVAARTMELAESTERLRRQRLLSELIIENSAEGIVVVDTELRHLVWNAGMERINGEPRSHVLGKTIFEVFPHFRGHPVGDAWEQAVSGQRAALRDFRFFSDTRGAEIVYDADFTPLYGQDGVIIGAVCMLRETTERHRMEEMLRQSQKMEAVAQLTGGVAHDFNNLLTAVIGCLDMIAADSNPRTARLAETALRSATRGTRLTQQLLAFARRQALHPVNADLNLLLAEIEVLLRRAVDETIEIIIEPFPGPVRCEIDPAQFEAAVMNLVINARDAMPEGGQIRLTTCAVKASDVPAELGLARGDYVTVAVHDTGEGMSPEVTARAFEPFFTTKEIGKGSGLGLSMVYGFAQQSGGGVRLESRPGAGTCVTLYLPAAAVDAERGEAVAEDKPGAGSGVILVVEDDDDVRDVSITILKSHGYRVLVARDGPEALGILRHQVTIDLMFTDLVMPGGISGAALAREAQLIRPDLKVLLTTGYAGLSVSEAEQFPLLAKPFRPGELAAAVAALVGQRG